MPFTTALSAALLYGIPSPLAFVIPPHGWISALLFRSISVKLCDVFLFIFSGKTTRQFSSCLGYTLYKQNRNVGVTDCWKVGCLSDSDLVHCKINQFQNLINATHNTDNRPSKTQESSKYRWLSWASSSASKLWSLRRRPVPARRTRWTRRASGSCFSRHSSSPPRPKQHPSCHTLNVTYRRSSRRARGCARVHSPARRRTRRTSRRKSQGRKCVTQALFFIVSHVVLCACLFFTPK